MKFEKWLTPEKVIDCEGQYKEYYHPWANYVVDIYPGYKFKNSSIDNWCEENLKGKYDLEFYCYFEFEEDSVMFALRWL